MDGAGRLIGLCGSAGAGKDTVADHLVAAHGFTRVAFAAALKDVVAALFGWPREALEGRTPEHRAWREEVDGWWAERLGIPGFSPRYALRFVGTEVLRQHLHPRLWVWAVERRVRQALAAGHRVVLTDCRFPEELEMVTALGGCLWAVQRGPAGQALPSASALRERGEHSSEWAWLQGGTEAFQAVLHNSGTVAQLQEAVEGALLGGTKDC